MALPSSGTITLAQIATEAGVSLPIDLNGNAARTLAGKPSGNIVMPNDFWGKSSYDPNADGISWPNAYDSNIGTAGATSSGTVSGINTTISITVAISSPCTVRKRMYLTCGGTVIADTTTGSSWTFNAANGQTIYIGFGCTQQYSPKQLNTLWQGTCTITNNTTGAGMGSFAFDILAEAEELGA